MNQMLGKILLITITLFAAKATYAQDLLVGEYFTNRIMRVAPDGTKTVFVQPTVPSGIRLCGFAFDAGGNLYAARLEGSTADANNPNNGILKITPTGTVSSFGGFVPGLPIDTAVDSVGNVYVSSINNGQVRRFSPTGQALGVFADVSSDAHNIAFDGTGNLFVASRGSGQVRRFSSEGVDLGLFAAVGGASSLAFDTFGDVYVGTNVGTIRRFSSAGVDKGQFATTPGANFNGLTFAQSGELFATNYQVSGGGVERFSASGGSLGAFSSGIASPVGIGFIPAIVAVPEPSALSLLAGIGIPGIILIVRRRRK